ncbi:MAG TPA: hypothetical protein VJ901_03290 [Thermoanaerobaculia bacterium]|nr:hypothetical protein [Thermoanaerobaculia bacterium]
MTRKFLLLALLALAVCGVGQALSLPGQPLALPGQVPGQAESLSYTTYTTRRTMPAPNEHLIRGGAVFDKHRLTDAIPAEDSDDPFALAEDRIVMPLRYPNRTFDPASRVRAYEELLAMRRAGTRSMTIVANSPGTTGPNGCAWVAAGPTNIAGRITGIAIDPINHDRVYTTGVGGIWRSNDGGRRWEHVSGDFLATIFGAIAVNPTTPDEIIAGGGDPNRGDQFRGAIGIWRSTSFGDPGTWTKVSPAALDNQIIFRIAIDPAGSNDVYVAASNGVWLGTHSGNSLTFARLGGFNPFVSDLAVDFSAMPRKVYAGVQFGSVSWPQKGIYKWDGAAWNKKDDGIPQNDLKVINLTLCASSPSTLYAKIEKTDNSLLGIFKTTAGGEGPNAWTLAPGSAPVNDSFASPTTPTSNYNSVIAVDPSDPMVVYTGGKDLWRTTNGGTLFDDVSAGADPNYAYATHADNHAIAFDPINPKIVWIGNDGGIDKSTNTAIAPWHWFGSSHGMQTAEMYALTSEREHPTLLAAGTQDNGSGITLGNFTWYNIAACDVYDVATDAKNPDTLFETCNQNTLEYANPVPGTIGFASNINWVTPFAAYAPVVTDPLLAGDALIAGGPPCGAQGLLKTTDGVHFTQTNLAPPPFGRVRLLAIAASSQFKTYYAGIAWFPQQNCAPQPQFNPTIWRSDDGGASWMTTPTGLPNFFPTSIVADNNDPLRAFVTFGSATGAIYMTTNGKDWSSIGGSGLTAIPPSSSIYKTALDPFDPNVIYAGTDVGVFRGVLTPGSPSSTTWTPFDEGVPDGLWINDLTVDPATGVLTLASYGHGSYQRDIRPNVACAAHRLVVRDNVFDNGREPSPFAIPDAEHPIPDPARPGFYKPDDTNGGRTYWWTSSDIRIDVPSNDPQQNTFNVVDSIEMQTCPTLIAKCPAGTMIDSPPEAAKMAHVYVQVANRGTQAVANTRVIAIWTAVSAAVPPLPASFWSQTFPANGPCGALDPATGWHLVDPANPCHTVASIGTDVPEVVRFDWGVPMGANGHACMITMVDSADDPLDPNIRAQNLVDAITFVAQSRHIAQRNLTIVPFQSVKINPPRLYPVFVPLQIINTTPLRGVEIDVSQVDLDDPVRFLLRPGIASRTISDSRLFLDLAPGESTTVTIMATPPRKSGTARFSVIERAREQTLGGNTYLLRPESQH